MVDSLKASEKFDLALLSEFVVAQNSLDQGTVDTNELISRRPVIGNESQRIRNSAQSPSTRTGNVSTGPFLSKATEVRFIVVSTR